MYHVDIEKFVWDSSFSVGDSKIDEDHKKILDIYNELLEYISSQGNLKNEFARILSQMTDYSLTHFQREELYMQNISFPHLREHKDAHRNYIYKVAMYNVNFLGPDSLDPEEVLNFLKGWWINHIIKLDSSYAKYKSAIESTVQY